MIDMLYKIETNMSKVNVEVRAMKNFKWTKCLDQLETIKITTWPYVDIDITIWELIVDLKAFPSASSDWCDAVSIRLKIQKIEEKGINGDMH